MTVKDKLALVTGGGRRLGAVICRELAAQGARVVVHHNRSEAEARELAQQIGGKALQADLCCADQREQLCQRVAQLAEQTPLAAIIHAAAPFRQVPFLEGDDALWREALEVNVVAPAALVRQLCPKMEEGGVVINILDVAAQKPWKGYAHHCVAKAGLQMLTRTLALELAPRLRVCGICPGVLLPPEQSSQSDQQRWQARVPLGRLGVPEDLLRAVRYLLAADYVTGEVLAVDGGLLCKG